MTVFYDLSFMTEAYGLWILHGSAFPWTASVEEHKRCKLNLHSVTEVNKIPLQQINVHINWTWNVTLIYHGQLSLREVITQKWIHAEICTLLANTLRRLRQVITPRRIHFEPMLLASLACSLRSRPQAASRPSASRMPGVSKITTGMLLLHILHQIYSILFQILDKKACTTIQTDCWFRLQDPTIFIFTFITTSPNLITII